MTKTYTRPLLVSLLLVAALLSPVLGAAGATGQIAERNAQLAIEQPHYIGSDVQTTTTNGTRTYTTTGAPLDIFPQNFDSEDVVDFGTTASGTLTYNERTGSFTLSTSKTGTYDVFWIVSETVAVNRTVQQTVERPVGNGSNATETVTENVTKTVQQTQQVRYTARVDVSGSLNMTHLAEGSLDETRESAEKWEDFNATVQELRTDNLWVDLGLEPPLSTDDTLQAMVDAYILTNDPLEALTGKIGLILFLVVSSLGGAALVIFAGGYHTVVVAFIMRKLNRHESIEKDEGAIAKRLEESTRRERNRAVANRPFTEVYGDEYTAEAMSEEGRNPLQAFVNFWGRQTPRGSLRWWLQVMGQNGYTAVVEDDDVPVADGGEDDAVTAADVSEVRIARTTEIGEDAVTLDLVDADDDLLDTLPSWSADTIVEFDLSKAEWDDSKLDGDLDVPSSLDEFVGQMSVDTRHFDDDEAAASIQLELLEHIRESTLTDDRGRVDGVRFWLEQHLDAANVFGDRFELPVDIHIQLLEAAIRRHDAAEQAKQTHADIQAGRYS